MTGRAYHFSHDPGMTEFVPHVAATSAEPHPCVWAIDAEHAPAYWFPRDCPRVTFWPVAHPSAEAVLLLAGARRVHAVEWAWLARIRDAVLYRYEFDAAEFRRYEEAAGYLVAARPVRPLAVHPVGDLFAAHAAAGIELRLVPNLWPLADLVRRSGLAFSMIRMRCAVARTA
ncbi:MAG TPA: hypothetical protein VGJ95_10970 [Pseudonocardiaceae bacterium]